MRSPSRNLRCAPSLLAVSRCGGRWPFFAAACASRIGGGGQRRARSARALLPDSSAVARVATAERVASTASGRLIRLRWNAAAGSARYVRDRTPRMVPHCDVDSPKGGCGASGAARAGLQGSSQNLRPAECRVLYRRCATLRLFVLIIARQPVHLSARQQPLLPCSCLLARPGEKRHSESLAAAHHLRTVARGSEVFGEPDRLQIRQAITRRRLRVT